MNTETTRFQGLFVPWHTFYAARPGGDAGSKLTTLTRKHAASYNR